MKITERQLRRIIREAMSDEPIRQVAGDSFSSTSRPLVPQDPNRPWGSYSQTKDESFRDVIVMSPNGDSVLVDGMETHIQDVPRQLEAVSGFPMKGNDPDNLIFALEEMWRDGYVELAVSYENGQWGW
tara:strand:- start:1193 stop:1576 length:384 start_codon:yes stop_codon:yes gene_type:complete